MIRQFVAMPLGMGYTVEGQVTGEERFGGVQLKVFEPKPGRFPDEPPWGTLLECCSMAPSGPAPAAPMGAVCSPRRSRAMRAGAMGLAAGGRMKQKVYPDPHGLGTWDAQNTARVFVHLVNSELWREITGEEPPASPVTARAYADHGLPWFDLYDEHASTLDPSDTLAGVKSVKELDADKSTLPLQDDEPVPVGPVRKLWARIAGGVRDGSW
jgi:hypothetical protein